MLKYIIRLDDACPNMNQEKWDKMEKLLDKYNIKPIVGIIPDNKDVEFNHPVIKDFWSNYAQKWQKKGWIIAQHGLNHNLSKTVRTEFVGKDYAEQERILLKGNRILKKHGIEPICFFAPAHSFNKDTVSACVKNNLFKFISDGYSIFPYKENDMLFFPSLFDTPHRIFPFGIYTFVYHPNNTSEDMFKYLENFIKNNINRFDVDINDLINNKYGKRTIIDRIIEFMIKFIRKLRKCIR